MSLKVLKIDVCNIMDLYETSARNYTTPELAWQAALKMTDVVLGLFTDMDMHLFIEEVICGDISDITHCFAKGNASEIESYGENKPSEYSVYLCTKPPTTDNQLPTNRPPTH